MVFRVEQLQPDEMFTFSDWPATIELITMQLNDWRTIMQRACALYSCSRVNQEPWWPLHMPCENLLRGAAGY